MGTGQVALGAVKHLPLTEEPSLDTESMLGRMRAPRGRECSRSGRDQSLLKPPSSRTPYGPLPRGRASASDQDDLYEVLRAQRTPRDALPKMQEQRTPAEGEGSAKGVGPALTSRFQSGAAPLFRRRKRSDPRPAVRVADVGRALARHRPSQYCCRACMAARRRLTRP